VIRQFFLSGKGLILISSGIDTFAALMSRLFHFLLPVLLLSSCETREVKIQQLLLKGNIALEASQPEQAAYYYNEALLMDSCFSDALNNLGTIAFRSGNWDEAVHRYDQAILCKPSPVYYLNRANAWFEAGAFFNVLKDLDVFEKAFPDTIPPKVLRGLSLTRLKRYDEALDLFSLILRNDSLNPEHPVNRGTLYYYRQQYGLAKKDLQKALELDSSNSQAYNTLAMIYADENAPDEAMELIGKALRWAPNHPHYLNNRGYIHILRGNLLDAETDINESMVREPDNPWVYRNKGIIYFETGDLVSADRMFRQVLSMDSSVDKATEYLGRTLVKAGKKQEGCRWLRKSPGYKKISSACS
jgi:tetratricopeptide (TPR) repeat protein